ncbi:PaaI family thioesterase [Nocardioides sp. BGMRC 2183]|nr:PaaI family thioesterase [Nocardioides sp. BGMRC 2183]
MIADQTRVVRAEDLEAFRVWLNGLEVLTGLGVRMSELQPGHAVAELLPVDRHRNPAGMVNGGYLLAAADVTGGAAVAAAAGIDDTWTTTDLSMHFLEGVVDGPLRIEADVVRRGRRSVVPTVRLLDGAGTLCAVATGTWVRVPGPNGPRVR